MPKAVAFGIWVSEAHSAAFRRAAQRNDDAVLRPRSATAATSPFPSRVSATAELAELTRVSRGSVRTTYLHRCREPEETCAQRCHPERLAGDGAYLGQHHLAVLAGHT